MWSEVIKDDICKVRQIKRHLYSFYAQIVRNDQDMLWKAVIVKSKIWYKMKSFAPKNLYFDTFEEKIDTLKFWPLRGHLQANMWPPRGHSPKIISFFKSLTQKPISRHPWSKNWHFEILTSQRSWEVNL